MQDRLRAAGPELLHDLMEAASPEFADELNRLLWHPQLREIMNVVAPLLRRPAGFFALHRAVHRAVNLHSAQVLLDGGRTFISETDSGELPHPKKLSDLADTTQYLYVDIMDAIFFLLRYRPRKPYHQQTVGKCTYCRRLFWKYHKKDAYCSNGCRYRARHRRDKSRERTAKQNGRRKDGQ